MAAHDCLPVVHAPYFGESLGSRADCCCGYTGDWTSPDEAEADVERHLLVKAALPRGRRPHHLPNGEPAAVTRENYAFLRDSGSTHLGACRVLGIDPDRFAVRMHVQDRRAAQTVSTGLVV